MKQTLILLFCIFHLSYSESTKLKKGRKLMSCSSNCMSCYMENDCTNSGAGCSWDGSYCNSAGSGGDTCYAVYGIYTDSCLYSNLGGLCVEATSSTSKTDCDMYSNTWIESNTFCDTDMGVCADNSMEGCSSDEDCFQCNTEIGTCANNQDKPCTDWQDCTLPTMDSCVLGQSQGMDYVCESGSPSCSAQTNALSCLSIKMMGSNSPCCVIQRPDGEDCVNNNECTSGTCDYMSYKCGVPGNTCDTNYNECSHNNAIFCQTDADCNKDTECKDPEADNTGTDNSKTENNAECEYKTGMMAGLDFSGDADLQVPDLSDQAKIDKFDMSSITGLNTVAKKKKSRRKMIRQMFNTNAGGRTVKKFAMKASKLMLDGFKRPPTGDNLIQMVKGEKHASTIGVSENTLSFAANGDSDYKVNGGTEANPSLKICAGEPYSIERVESGHNLQIQGISSCSTHVDDGCYNNNRMTFQEPDDHTVYKAETPILSTSLPLSVEYVFVFNVEALPVGGASYRTLISYEYGNPVALNLGLNTITIRPDISTRNVKIQFTSEAITINSFKINGDEQLRMMDKLTSAVTSSASQVWTPSAGSFEYYSVTHAAMKGTIEVVDCYGGLTEVVTDSFGSDNPVYVPLEKDEAVKVKVTLDGSQKVVMMHQISDTKMKVKVDSGTTVVIEDGGSSHVEGGIEISFVGSGGVETVQGCMDPNYDEYDASATQDTSPTSCITPATCTSSDITCQNGGAISGDKVNGCSCDCSGTGYQGSNCQTLEGCMDNRYDEYDASAIQDTTPTSCITPATCTSSDITCQNSGAVTGDKVDGCSCDCSGTGYEGSNCQTLSCADDVQNELFCSLSDAQARASVIGCSGYHQHSPHYMPCSTHSDYDTATAADLTGVTAEVTFSSINLRCIGSTLETKDGTSFAQTCNDGYLSSGGAPQYVCSSNVVVKGTPSCEPVQVELSAAQIAATSMDGSETCQPGSTSFSSVFCASNYATSDGNNPLYTCDTSGIVTEVNPCKPQCSSSVPTGYTGTPDPRFQQNSGNYLYDVTDLTCDTHYHVDGSIALSTSCSAVGGSVVLSGCALDVCSNTIPTGYIKTSGNDWSIDNFNINLACDSGYVQVGGVFTVTACSTHDGQLQLSGGQCVSQNIGCMDSSANNYNPYANQDDGSCTYDCTVCTHGTPANTCTLAEKDSANKCAQGGCDSGYTNSGNACQPECPTNFYDPVGIDHVNCVCGNDGELGSSQFCYPYDPPIKQGSPACKAKAGLNEQPCNCLQTDNGNMGSVICSSSEFCYDVDNDSLTAHECSSLAAVSPEEFIMLDPGEMDTVSTATLTVQSVICGSGMMALPKTQATLEYECIPCNRSVYLSKVNSPNGLIPKEVDGVLVLQRDTNYAPSVVHGKCCVNSHHSVCASMLNEYKTKCEGNSTTKGVGLTCL